MPLFASVDLLSTAYVTTVLVDKHQLILSGDPPPIYYLGGGLEWLFHPAISSQIDSLFTSSASYTPATTVEALAAQTPGINVLVAVLKLPYLAADLTVALVLPRFFSDGKHAYGALLLWWFNPISIYVSYFIGQYDVLATAFLVIAYYLLRTNRNLGSVFFLGFAVFFELFAIIVIPFILLYRIRASDSFRNALERVLGVILAPALALVTLIVILHFQPAYYESANFGLRPPGVDGFFGTTIYNRGVATQPVLAQVSTFLGFSAQFNLNSGLSDVILVVVVAYGVLLLLFSRVAAPTWENLCMVTLATFMTFYALSGFLVQWVVWSLPFLTLILAKDLRRSALPYLLFTVGLFAYAWYFRAALFGALLQVSFPSLTGADPIAAMNSIGLPGLLVVNVVRSLFSVACLWFAYWALRPLLGKGTDGPVVAANP